MSTGTTAPDTIWKDTVNLSAEQTTSTTDSVSELPTQAMPLPMPVYEVATSQEHDRRDRSCEGQMASQTLSPFTAAELADYLTPFGLYFKRSEGRQSLAYHLTGLLANINRKNGEQIAHAIAGTNSQRLQALLTELQWDAAALNQQRVRQLIREATTRGGTLICGEVEMQKQGSSSVGVARQYVDRLGRMKNCQLLLSWQYVDSAFSWPVNAQLYLPQEWVQNPERCRRARIPEEARRFQTKPEIVLNLLDEAKRWGVPYRGIASAAAYGSEPLFLAELEQRGIEYIVTVPEEFEIQAARRRSLSGESAKEATARLADDAWQAIAWPRGAGYGNRNLWARVMGWRVTPTGPEAFGWLVAERPLGRRRGPVRYYFTNASPQTSLSTLARLARRPLRIDEFYQFAKNDLGWSHYEGRLWHGLHRHALLVFLAHSFLLLRRNRQSRQGRGSESGEGGAEIRRW
jgi:SRSO17 transposase